MSTMWAEKGQKSGQRTRGMQVGVGDLRWRQGTDALGQVSGIHLTQETEDRTATVCAADRWTLGVVGLLAI